ncbi:hypothetical protein FNH22_15770 [Fulvivirga sp. M361]|uniref:hypothetical protein n=1 Tax=Fulvivirga sp. M361 TaxID=2594266 RepID=UPI00117B7A2F|nr:hypothetical protein [Fulvivirga sp. M361]TRX57596.1 hypothetical protein FNH22_15770 [Fulvivirga sp. M361]
MKVILTLSLLLLLGFISNAQKKDQLILPYQEIPDYPEKYSAGSVAARMVDGLGFRYYWATEGLRVEDLAFRPTTESRSADETLDHILSLSTNIINAARKVPNEGGVNYSELTFEEKRRRTLTNLKEASDVLRKTNDAEFETLKVIFKRGENTSEYPFWNLLNGPVADALGHVGQVVSFRRTSGNPSNPKVSVFTGRLRN